MKKLLLLLSLLLATNAWGEEDSTYLLCQNGNKYGAQSYGIELFNNFTEARYIVAGTNYYSEDEYVSENWSSSINVRSNGVYSITKYIDEEEQRYLDINRTDLSMEDITITWKSGVPMKVTKF